MPNQPPTSAQAHETGDEHTPPERGRYKMYYGGELVGEGEVEVMTGDIIVSCKSVSIGKVYAADPSQLRPRAAERDTHYVDASQLRTWRQERG
jgi:hypothetical protein